MLMTGGDIEQAWKMAGQGALFGGIAGGALGGYRGYKSAKMLGKNPWTGINSKEIQITKSKFGHTFDRHGENSTNYLKNRASGSGEPQGQFLDNQRAAKVIADNLDKTRNGAINIPLPEGVPARVVMPNGSFRQATQIRLVPGGNGVKTAYPIF